MNLFNSFKEREAGSIDVNHIPIDNRLEFQRLRWLSSYSKPTKKYERGIKGMCKKEQQIKTVIYKCLLIFVENNDKNIYGPSRSARICLSNENPE